MPTPTLSWTFRQMPDSIREMYRKIFSTRMFGHVEDLDEYKGDGEAKDRSDVLQEHHNVVVSKVREASTVHRPVIDLDIPAFLIPSSTPDHSHLYLNTSLTWEDYKKLLNVLAEVGIIEEGYAQASIARGYTAVRLPWVRKK